MLLSGIGALEGTEGSDETVKDGSEDHAENTERHAPDAIIGENGNETSD